MKKILSDSIETAKTVVMILLFSCVLILLGVYISLLSDTWTNRNAEGALAEEVRLLASGEGAKDYPSGTYLLPESVALKTVDGAHVIFQQANGILKDYYTKLAELISATAAHTDGFVAVTGKTAETLWSSVGNQTNCIYVSYHTDVPLQLIGYFSAALSEQALRVGSVAPVWVRELVIYEAIGSSGRCGVLIRSSDGTVYTSGEWTDAGAVADMYAYSRYEMEKAVSVSDAHYDFEFAGKVFPTGENPFSTPTVPVVLTGFRTSKFRFSESDMLGMLKDKKDVNTFLRLFSYNPNKINRHEEANGTVVYVEEHGVLKISSTTVSYTAAQGGGVSVSGQLGAASGGVDLYDSILYATQILDGLYEISPACLGGDCHLILESVQGGEGRLELRFRYYADNLEIRGQQAEVLFVFAANKLVSAVVEGFSGYNVADADHLYSQAWVAERFYSSLGTISQLKPLYEYQTNKSASASWIAIAAEKEAAR